jgi:hypothetical protein
VAFPTPILEIAFTTAPLASSPVWVNITEQLRQVQTRRGRQRELDTFDAGTASFLVDDQDRRFDSTYAGTLVNLVPNPSAEVNIDGFNINSNATVARSTTQFLYGSASFEATATGGTMSVEWRADSGGTRIAATAGTTYTFSVYCKLSSAYGWTPRLQITWVDAALSAISTADGSATSVGTSWTRITITATAPANTAFARIVWRQDTTPTAGQIAYFDGVQLEAAGAASTYTDGSLDNCRWAGTAHASTSYRGGPYYGYLLPMRRIRMGITVGATTYYLYNGYVETFQPVWDSAFTAACRIDCIDGFDIVANAVLAAGTRGSELTGARVGWALDAVGWPASDRDIDTGQTTLPSFTVTAGSEPSALSHLLDVADSELGAVFIKADGKAAFFDRHRTLKTPFTTSQATFGDTSDSDIPYEALAPSYDRDLIRNEIKVTRPGGSTQTASDSSSQSAYGRRTHTRAPLLTSDTESLNMAQYLAGAYAQPALRFDSLTLEPLESDALWTLVGDLEVWDRVTVKRTPPGGGSAIVQDCLIEGIEHAGSPAGAYWQTTYRLSPANTTLFLVLDDTVNGVLDSARIAY